MCVSLSLFLSLFAQGWGFSMFQHLDVCCTEIPNMRGTSSDCLGKRTGEACTISPGLTDTRRVILWHSWTRGRKSELPFVDSRLYTCARPVSLLASRTQQHDP